MTKALRFPSPESAGRDGLLAVGGDLSPERLELAYSMGIFPWYHEGQPILWHSPDPRMVLEPSALHVSHSLRRLARRGPFEVRLDSDFSAVIRACAEVPRADGAGTWITGEMIDAYCRLHERGRAHSAEAWEDGVLVGGLYGVSLGACFFGESMFTLRPNASKVAFVALVRQLAAWDFALVDCQQNTEHLARFGAVDWSRKRFLAALASALEVPTRHGVWRFDADRDGATNVVPPDAPL